MRLLLKILAAPLIAVLALVVWICSGLLYCTAFIFGPGCGGARHLLGSKRYHSPGDCLPRLSHGPAYGCGVAAGKAPGPALYHSGLDLRISQTKTAPTLKKRRGCS